MKAAKYEQRENNERPETPSVDDKQQNILQSSNNVPLGIISTLSIFAVQQK